jgi:hypothetical protein
VQQAQVVALKLVPVAQVAATALGVQILPAAAHQGLAVHMVVVPEVRGSTFMLAQDVALLKDLAVMGVAGLSVSYGPEIHAHFHLLVWGHHEFVYPN